MVAGTPILAADLGYSSVKVATPQGLFSFPSVVAQKPPMGALTKRYETYAWNGEEYLVGEDALRFPHNIVEGKSEDASIVLGPLFLAKAFREAAKRLGSGLEEVRPGVVAVSIAVNEYQKPVKVVFPSGEVLEGKKDELLEQVLRRFEVNGKVYEQDVVVLPQGKGIYYDVGAPERVLIIDVGFKTIDILYLEKEEETPEVVYARGIKNQGVMTIADMVGKAVESATGIFLPLEEAERSLREGSVLVEGKKVSLEEIVPIEQLKVQFIKRILSIVEQDPNLSPLLGKVPVVLAGGGGYYVPESFRDRIHVPEKPEYSNVRGFLKMIEGGE